MEITLHEPDDDDESDDEDDTDEVRNTGTETLQINLELNRELWSHTGKGHDFLQWQWCFFFRGQMFRETAKL